LTLLRLPEQIELTLQDLQLNRMTDLLYDISVKFSEFYTHSKVLKVPEEKSRIILLEATKRIMKQIFTLLGMETIERI